jgi:DNA oxidative demethylase
MDGLPEGFVYRDELVSRSDEEELVERFAELDFEEIRIRGFAARRVARHYGYGYDYERRQPRPGEPLPGWLELLQSSAAELAAVEPEQLVEALVQRYPAGAGIGWHRDAPAFGVVVGVSLVSTCRLRFRRGRVGSWETAELELAPRSGYVLAGAARWSWQHSIPATRELRYSVTFRTLR